MIMEQSLRSKPEGDSELLNHNAELTNLGFVILFIWEEIYMSIEEIKEKIKVADSVHQLLRLYDEFKKIEDDEVQKTLFGLFLEKSNRIGCADASD